MLVTCAECVALLDPNSTEDSFSYTSKAAAGCQADTKCNDCDGSFTCGTEQCVVVKLPPDCGRYMVYSEQTDECISPCGTSNDPCRPPTECVAVNASVNKDRFMCTACPTGFTRNDFGDCEDANECSDPSTCPAGTTCENLRGTFKCSDAFDAARTESPATGRAPPTPTGVCATNQLAITCPSTSLAAGTSAKLQCSESASSASTIISFGWRQIAGTTVDLATAPSGSASAVLELPLLTSNDVYQFELLVTDDCGATARGVATVTVASTLPTTETTTTLTPLDVGMTRTPLRLATSTPTLEAGSPVRTPVTGALSLAAKQHASGWPLLPVGMSVLGLWMLQLAY